MVYQRFKFIKQVDEPVNCYGKVVKTGDEFSLPQHLAIKALKFPDYYELIPSKPKGRPKKDGNESGNQG